MISTNGSKPDLTDMNAGENTTNKNYLTTEELTPIESSPQEVFK